jgi:anti-sigma regulatory factor (Ser/Thr protein kinase)
MDSRGFEVRLPPVPVSAGAARRYVEDALRGWLDRDRMEQVRVAVSELVANCVRHARLGPADAVEVVGSIDPRTLRIEVRDVGPGFEPHLERLGDADTGWGLYILDQLADRWGTAPARPSAVWFEMDLNAAGGVTG